MGRATPDANSQFTVIGASSVDGVTPIELYVNPANHAAYVELVAGTITGANGAILDGVDDGIEATVFDLTNSNPLATQIVDADGTAIVSFGGGTQYTEGDTDASITGTAVMWEDAANTLVAVSVAKPLPVEITDASVAVTGTFWQATQPVSGTFWQATQPVSIAAAVAVTGTFWQATQPVSIAGTVTVDGSGVTQPVSGTVTANLSATDNAVLDAIALAVATEGDALGDGVLIQGDDGIDRTNVLVDADGHLQVDVLAAPSTVVTATNLDIRDLTSTDVVTVTGGAGQTADVKITLDSESVAVTGTFWQATQPVSGTFWQATQPVSGTVTANLSATDNAVLDAIELDTTAVQTAVELLDNAVDGNYLNVNLNVAGTDVAANAGVLNAQTLRVTIATDDEVNNFLGAIDADTSTLSGAVSGSEMQVDVVAALPAGTNAIGKLAANSGVDIGDVDVTSISAGANLIGDVGISGARTSGGTTLYKNIDVDETEDQVKAVAGQVYWVHAINLTDAPLYLKFYNATAANVTVGTTVPDLTFPVPGNANSDGAGFTFAIPNGIAFGTAITIAGTTGVADNDSGAPAANALVVNLGYA